MPAILQFGVHFFPINFNSVANVGHNIFSPKYMCHKSCILVQKINSVYLSFF